MSIARSDVDSELSRGSPPGDLYRDRKATALEAAEHLERKHPNSDTVVTDAAGRSRTSPTRAALTNRTCRSFSRLRATSGFIGADCPFVAPVGSRRRAA